MRERGIYVHMSKEKFPVLAQVCYGTTHEENAFFLNVPAALSKSREPRYSHTDAKQEKGNPNRRGSCRKGVDDLLGVLYNTNLGWS